MRATALTEASAPYMNVELESFAFSKVVVVSSLASAISCFGELALL